MPYRHPDYNTGLPFFSLVNLLLNLYSISYTNMWILITWAKVKCQSNNSIDWVQRNTPKINEYKINFSMPNF